MNQSIWQEGVEMPSFEPLNQNIQTDVLIIGGGLCGILCAYYLKQAGINCVLLEGDRIGRGVTQNTTAKITSQHGLLYKKLMKKVGKEGAKLYLDANQNALAEYKTLCQSIDCDFETKTNFVYSIDDTKKIEDEVMSVIQLGLNAKMVRQLPLPFPIAGAISFENQAQFHPLKFIASIAKDLPIYENSFVKELRGYEAVTDGGTVKAEKIIITTHFPFLNKHGSYFVKLYQHRSYLIALEQGPQLDGMYVDEAQNGLSFRNYQNYLLIGGGGHKTGKQGGNWRELRTVAKRFYPDLTEAFSWATQDCMPLDHMPYIGLYANQIPNLYVATGFQKWGMTSSMVSALLLRDLIQGKENPYQDLFSPQRSIATPQLLVNGATAVFNLLTPTTKRCPHLGCALKWNKAEHTWDCPCHGSRFSKDGKLLDNPATGGISID